MEKLDELKQMYEEGYRCIYTDKDDNGLTVHLKDFYNERSDTISTNESEEIDQMESFLNNVEFEQYFNGYDIICTDCAE
ncbi:MAG: hypothetical protein ATN31_06795 [Candidatus Epulonipiscioides saccharophilum]|nr:MAG: hypothetical protein ATN31_06795 [Epulopiscium sp. AS2M-Bin001]